MVLHSDISSRPLQYSLEPQRRRTMKPTHTSLIAWHVIAICYYLYTSVFCNGQSIGTSTLRDLTHTFDDNTIYWVTAKRLNFTVTYNGTFPGQDYWVQVDEIAAPTHGGTHMDAPCHFALGKWCISDIPLERLVVPAVVVDISRIVEDNPTVHLSSEHLVQWERLNGRIPDGVVLLIRTGWSRFWPDPLKYSGTLEKNDTLLKFPSIRPDAAKWLLANRNIVGIGIDTMSVDIPGQTPETHVMLYDKNIYGLENVNLIDPLPPKGIRLYVMPMKLKGASGAPCRIFAEY